MSREDFQKVAVFVRSHIDSVGQLEILLLLHAAKGERRSAQQINEQLRSNLRSVESRLGGLEGHGLVASEGSGDQRTFHYAPRNPELAAKVDMLAVVYQDFRGRIIDLIFSPKDRLRDFSDAFRIKDEEDPHA